jgi:hypothetical protein
MSFMLMSHVLASSCLYINSKAMYSYIPNPCGTPSVFFACFFQVVSPPSDIISKWLISTWCQQGREEEPPGGLQCSKSTSGNVTRALLSFKLPPCMICSKLPCLTSVCSCVVNFNTHIVHTLKGSLVCIMLVS